MIGKTIAFLMVTSLLIPAALAEPAFKLSGSCNLDEWVDGIHYTGSGEFKSVWTSSGNVNSECHGLLAEDSAIPEKAIVINRDGEKKVITPSGHFSWIAKLGKNS